MNKAVIRIIKTAITLTITLRKTERKAPIPKIKRPITAKNNIFSPFLSLTFPLNYI